MVIERSDLIKLSIFVILCFIGGVMLLRFVRTFIPGSYSGPPFWWLHIGVIVTAMAVPSGYWIFTRWRVDTTRDLARIGFVFHLLGYTAINAMLIAYNLLITPNRWWFFYPLAGWGLGLAAHGILVWRMKEPPEELFP